MNANSSKRRIFILVITVMVILLPSLVLNDLGKGKREGKFGAYELGCGDSGGELGCHGSMPSPDVSGDLDFPYEYDRGGEYTLEIRIAGDPQIGANGPQGGFNLKVSHGTLELPFGATDVQILGQEAAQTEDGSNQHLWSVIWIAPGDSDPDVTFWLSVNAVNGDDSAIGDQWIQFVAKSTSSGKDFQGDGGGDGSSSSMEIKEEEDITLLYRPIALGIIVGVVLLSTTVFTVRRYTEMDMSSKRRERSALEKRSQQNKIVDCPECGSEVKASRLDSHIKKVHGRGD